MALSWSARRQFLYYAVATAFFLVVLVVLQQTFLSAAPTCFDKKENGQETGVDCGGTCSLLCKDTARDAQVLWARAFETDPNLYTAVAYVQNPNSGAGAKNVSYSLRLLDENGLLISTREGSIDLPPIPTVPVVEPNIEVGNRAVARTLLSLTNASVWNKVDSKTLQLLHIVGQELAENGTRLSVTIANDSLTDAKNVTVVAVLFDASDTARAASKSFVETISRKSSQTVVFTWPKETEDIVRAEITILPSF